MNWIKVHERLERSAIDMMDHARHLKKNFPGSHCEAFVATAMCLAELARGLAAGITEGDRLIHNKETKDQN